MAWKFHENLFILLQLHPQSLNPCLWYCRNSLSTGWRVLYPLLLLLTLPTSDVSSSQTCPPELKPVSLNCPPNVSFKLGKLNLGLCPPISRALGFPHPVNVSTFYFHKLATWESSLVLPAPSWSTHQRGLWISPLKYRLSVSIFDCPLSS